MNAFDGGEEDDDAMFGDEEEAQSPNFNDYTNYGEKELDFADMASPSHNTIYPTTQMTTEDNEDLISYAATAPVDDLNECRLRSVNNSIGDII